MAALCLLCCRRRCARHAGCTGSFPVASPKGSWNTDLQGRLKEFMQGQKKEEEVVILSQET